MTAIRNKLLNTSKKSNAILLGAIIVFLAASGVFISDFYVPSLPAIQNYFATSTTHVKLTISLYLMGIGFSQLVFGPLSDRFGRRKTILFGLSITFLSSLLCLHAQTINQLLLGRILQGIGMGGMSGVRSISKEAYNPDQAKTMIGYFALAIGIAPALAPILGGYVQHYTDWHGVFRIMVGLMGFTLLITYLFLPETNLNPQKNATNLNIIYKNYKRLFGQLHFWTGVLTCSLPIAGIYIYYSFSPFIIQTQMGYSALAFSMIAIATSAAMIVGRICNVKYGKYFELTSLVRFGCIITFTGSVLMFIPMALGIFNLYTLVIPMTIYILGTGFIFGNAMLVSLEDNNDIIGSTCGLFGSLQLLFPFALSGICSSLPAYHGISLSASLVVTGIVPVIMIIWLTSKQSTKII